MHVKVEEHWLKYKKETFVLKTFLEFPKKCKIVSACLPSFLN